MTNFERKRKMALSMRSEAIVLEYWPVYLLISVAIPPAVTTSHDGRRFRSSSSDAARCANAITSTRSGQLWAPFWGNFQITMAARTAPELLRYFLSYNMKLNMKLWTITC
jgi:hypothetical protein